MATNGWCEVSLEEVADEITVGHVGPMATEYVENGIPFLRSTNIEPFNIKSDDLKYISPDFHDKLRKSALKPGDVVIVRTGKPGACTIIPPTLPVANCSDLVIVRCGSALDARFLAYYVNSSAQHHVAAHLVGAVQQHFNVGSARTLKMRLPPLAEQRAIAGVLGALDDKIELNRRMNETLEALAQTEFRRMMEEGGETTALGELAAIQGGKQLPTEECLPSGRHKVFGANGIMGYAERATHTDFVIAFGRVGAYCGSIHWSYSGAWINNNASSIVPYRWPEFVLQAMLNVDFAAMRTGSAQPFIPNSALASAEIERPPDKVLDAYCSVVRPLRLKQDSLEKESRTLAALRDALLPKLLSGEVRVSASAKATARQEEANA